MLTVSIAAAVATMLLMPGLLAAVLVRGRGMPARLLLVGAATFLLSQAIRLPLLQGLTHLFASGALPAPDPAYTTAFNIAVLAFTAGLFEETARYIALRKVIPEARSWTAAVTFGAGHGGVECLILGGLMGLEFANMLALAGTSALPGLTADQNAVLAAQVQHYWSTPPYMPWLGVIERVSAITFHLAMAVLVLQAVKRRNLGLLALAIALHTATNALAVAALQAYGPVAAEMLLLAMAAVAAAYLVATRRRDTETVPRSA